MLKLRDLIREMYHLGRLCDVAIQHRSKTGSFVLVRTVYAYGAYPRPRAVAMTPQCDSLEDVDVLSITDDYPDSIGDIDLDSTEYCVTNLSSIGEQVGLIDKAFRIAKETSNGEVQDL